MATEAKADSTLNERGNVAIDMNAMTSEPIDTSVKTDEVESDIPETNMDDNTDKLLKASLASYTVPTRTKPFIILVACAAALGGLIFGYDIGGAGGTFVMTGFKEHFGWECAPNASFDCVPASSQQQNLDTGLINGLFGVGATFGAILSPRMIEGYGRKKGLLVASIIFIFGAGMQAGAPTMQVMWSGRIFSGLAIGSLSMNVPVYIGELAPEHVRGVLSSLWQLAVTFGILIAASANLGLENWDQGWRISYGGNIVFAIMLIIALGYMPESPRWLAGKGREDDLRDVLIKTRFDDEVEEEHEKLIDEVAEEIKLGVAPWSEVLSKKNNMRYRLYLGIALQTSQQLCGINAIMFYAPTIMKQFFGEDKSIIASFILYLVNFFGTFICIYAVERVGRVKLLFSGGIIMVFALIAQSVLSAIDQTPEIGYIVMVFAVIFIIAFAYSWGPVVWIFCSEMFPLQSRGKAVAITTMTNWIWTTIVGAVFPAASDASLAGCFGFFACVICIGTTVIYLYQPETAKKTITEIDEVFDEHEAKAIRKKW